MRQGTPISLGMRVPIQTGFSTCRGAGTQKSRRNVVADRRGDCSARPCYKKKPRCTVCTRGLVVRSPDWTQQLSGPRWLDKGAQQPPERVMRNNGRNALCERTQVRSLRQGHAMLGAVQWHHRSPSYRGERSGRPMRLARRCAHTGWQLASHKLHLPSAPNSASVGSPTWNAEPDVFHTPTRSSASPKH